MEQLAKSRPSLLRGGIPGHHLELGCKIVDEGDRVSPGLGRYRRCECSGERDHGCGQKGTSQHGRLRGSVWWINDRTVCAADLLADIRQIPGGFEGRIGPLNGVWQRQIVPSGSKRRSKHALAGTGKLARADWPASRHASPSVARCILTSSPLMQTRAAPAAG